MPTSAHIIPPIIDVQQACECSLPVSQETLIHWASLPLSSETPIELTLRLVTRDEIQHLNHSYRKLDKPTNVLAFPSQIPDTIPQEVQFLGDVIICPSILDEEAEVLQRSKPAHWAHIIIHGILHLMGYDHHEPEETHLMQSLEIQFLASLGFENPYSSSEPG
ncbi:MAG: rRNA maturation RNase YbeY [Legionellaceae bacterium]|nr:rRNA maturation RNase YbeY [Legionellaceae bacterium]